MAKYIHVFVSEKNDTDVIKFLESQKCKSDSIKFIIRKLIQTYGYKDILEVAKIKIE